MLSDFHERVVLFSLLHHDIPVVKQGVRCYLESGVGGLFLVDEYPAALNHAFRLALRGKNRRGNCQ
jgi:hypothetical protein